LEKSWTADSIFRNVDNCAFLCRAISHFYETTDFRESIRNLLSTLRTHTRFECVGIRLRSGEDYPYFETLGFPERFLAAERYLCARQDGNIVRDAKGRPYLECMCGNILSGRTDPSLPFFTPFGSFWTNSTSDLLSATSQEDLQTRTRNRCNTAGYESVALIPIYDNKERVGLLQFNDSRRDMFGAGTLDTLEHLSFIIGIYLSRMFPTH
jgi:GAF domain-containing protein